MYVLKEKYTTKETFIPSETELYDWWAFAAADEVGWNEMLKTLNEGFPVYLNWYSLEKFSGNHIPPKFEPSKTCRHPKKYKNVISKNLFFWFCPDCKEEVK